jgi:putative oxidoreductase
MIPGDTPLVPRDRWLTARGFLFRQPARLLRDYPWWPLGDAMRLLRYVTALLFMAHASMRFVYGSIPQFAWAMEHVHGFSHGERWVLAITAYELGAGTLLLLNRGVRWAASGLAVIVSVGIYLIHRHLGWFVGEHGTGGSEYSVALLAMLLVLAAWDAEQSRQRRSTASSP